MRTTLTIDDRLAKTLRALAHRSGKPFKQVINETLHGCAIVSADSDFRRFSGVTLVNPLGV